LWAVIDIVEECAGSVFRVKAFILKIEAVVPSEM
jgi:hypothetical protein